MFAGETPDAMDENLNPNFVNDKIDKSVQKYSLTAQGLTVAQSEDEIIDEPPLVLKTEHIKIYQRILAYYSWLGLWFGVEHQFSWKRYRSPLMWIICFLLALCNYCLLYNYRKGEYDRILEPMSCVGICFTCTIKWVIYLKFLNTVLAMMFDARRICENISSGPRADTMATNLQGTYRLIRLYTIGLVVVIIFYVSVAMKFFLIDGIYYPLMPVNIPYINGETLKGYLLMLGFHSVFGVYSGVGTLAFGTAFLILLGNYGLMADLVEMDIKDLNQMFTRPSETTVAYRHAFLHNIVKKLHDMQRYLNEIKSVYEKKFFVYFLVSYVGQVICLYQITQRNWIPGYTPLFTVFIEMSFYCGLGFGGANKFNSIGTAFLILLGNYGLMADLVEMDIKDLNQMFTRPSETTVAYRHAFLHNIVKKLHDMQRYLNEIKSVYEKKFFVYFLVSYVGQVICLYQITQRNWIPGYTPLFTVFIEMSFYCGLGTRMAILGEKMCSCIEDTDWYLYDIYTQKTFRFMLQLCQLPCEISLQSLGPLNMVTGVGVVKGIYSYYTVLTEMM